MSGTCKAGSDGLDVAPGEAGPALMPPSSCPLACGATEQPGQGRVGSCPILAGSGWKGSRSPALLCSVNPALGSPESRQQHCILVKTGQKLGCPRMETITQYWTSPLCHLGFVTWIKWAIKSPRCHPRLCNCRRVASSFRASICPSVEWAEQRLLTSWNIL